MTGRKEQKSHSVFSKVMRPLMVLLAIECLLLVAALMIGAVPQRLNQNAEDMLRQQTENRKNYLEAAMVDTWSDLRSLSQEINRRVEVQLQEGTLSLETIGTESDDCAPLLLDLTDDLISTMRLKSVNGLFIIFNTDDLSGGLPDSRTGIYIMDMDSVAAPSITNSDLLLEHAPISVVKGLTFSTDTDWTPRFTFEDDGNHDYLQKPIQAALAAERIHDPADYGCWVSQPSLKGVALSYSVPLVLEDGTVYGVLGVTLLEQYLETLLPAAELLENGQGAYLLAVRDPEGGGLIPTALSSEDLHWEALTQQIALPEDGSASILALGQRSYYTAALPLSLYNSHTPFLSAQWYLLGLAPVTALYELTSQIMWLLYMALLLTLAGGLAGSLVISHRISVPIRQLEVQVEEARKSREGIPHLSATGIREIDHFSTAFTDLSRDVLTASTRFLRILEMASAEIGGFELRDDGNGVYVTDNFFSLLGQEQIDTAGLSVQDFFALLAKLDATLTYTAEANGGHVYQVPQADGSLRYVRVQISALEDRQVGLAEDVTQATQERLRIEHDRDYDLLTGLLNRRAFYRMAEKLFQEPQTLGHAALIMLDMDDLKGVNDHFGHDWGDQYIRQAGRCFSGSVPKRSLCSRISGDEFYLLLYGYESQEAVRADVCHLEEQIRRNTFQLPSGETNFVQVSGGVAWYPENGKDFWQLMRFADFAMYQVKRKQKGRLGEFDPAVYAQENTLSRSRQEFSRLLAERTVKFHFQPIVNAVTGQTMAYEALMRAEQPILRSPETVLRIARETGRLQEVEGLTWLKAPADFRALLKEGAVEQDALLFINSIASVHMSDRDVEEFKRQHGDIQKRIVVEITESEDLSLEAVRVKRATEGCSGLYALDDYGSGYNSEKNLLELRPHFIKVDMSIIRGIDADANKQSIFSTIARYAHEQQISVVAEGVETAEELRTVLRLGVDLLQGYFLARPAAVPLPVDAQALEIIRAQRRSYDRPGD